EESYEREQRGSEGSGQARCGENGKVGEEARGKKSSEGQSQAQREEGISDGEQGLSDYPASHHHRKGLGREGNAAHRGVRGGEGRDQDRNQGSGAARFQGESRSRAHGDFPRQVPQTGTRRGFPQRLEEGVCAAEGRRKDDRVRREYLV